MLETLLDVSRNIKRRPFQSVLAVLGIFFGMSGIIILSSMGIGVQQSITAEVAAIGPGMMSVQAAPPTQANPTSVNLQYSDAQAIASDLSSQAEVTPLGEAAASIQGPQGESSGYAIGANENFPQIEAISVPAGHFYSSVDTDEQNSVCVISTGMVHQLFGSANPIGGQITVNGNNLRVVGTFKFSNGVSVSGDTGMVLMPITTYLADLSGNEQITGILLKANQVSQVSRIQNEVLTVLARDNQWKVPVSSFQVSTQNGILSSSNSLKHLFSLFVRGAVLVAFIVGGIGIMNVMLMAVTDRKREIGVYLAFGATRLSIIREFLLESTMLSFVGTVLGIVTGTLVGLLLLTKGIPVSFTAGSYVEDVGVGLFIGILFGIYPSLRAAQLTPMQAIRE